MLILPSSCHKNHLAHTIFSSLLQDCFAPCLCLKTLWSFIYRITPHLSLPNTPYPFSWSVNLLWGAGVDCGVTQTVLQPSGEVIDEHIHPYCIQMHTIGEDLFGENGRVFQNCPALCDANWTCPALQSVPVLFNCGWVSCNPVSVGEKTRRTGRTVHAGGEHADTEWPHVAAVATGGSQLAQCQEHQGAAPQTRVDLIVYPLTCHDGGARQVEADPGKPWSEYRHKSTCIHKLTRGTNVRVPLQNVRVSTGWPGEPWSDWVALRSRQRMHKCKA